MNDSRERFSDRVDHYVRSRPGYPDALFDDLDARFGIAERVIADLGSGTGIFTGPLLDRGARVLAVEPNAPMRNAAELEFRENASFESHACAAEATDLADDSVDWAVAAQAFHWFDRPKLRCELDRIVRPGGYFVIVWNARRLKSTPFLEDYEKLLQDFSVDYKQVDHLNIEDEEIQEFFGSDVLRKDFANHQDLDHDGLVARVLSSSYTPPPDHERHAPMLEEVSRLFCAHETAKRVRIDYETRTYSGRVGSSSG